MGPHITLYDIPFTLSPKQASSNTLKVRYALGIKQLQFTTVWVQYPDIASVAKSLGASPTHGLFSAYTVPIITDASTNAVITGGYDITEYLDRYADTPKLLHEGSREFEEKFDRITGPAYPILLPHIMDIVPPEGRAYFRETREKMIGKRLEDLCPPGSEERARLWREVEKCFDTLDTWRNARHASKVRFTDEALSYADVAVAAFLNCYSVVLPKEDWETISKWHDGRWKSMLDEFEQWNL